MGVRRLGIVLLVLLALVCAIGALGFFAAPYFLRTRMVAYVQQHYGRELQLGDIHVNPFNLTLDITRLRLPDADGQTMIAFERLHLDLRLESLWRLSPVLREVALEQPYVRVLLRAGGALNLADLTADRGATSTGRPASESGRPVAISIEHLTVANGGLTFEDHSRAEPIRVDFKPVGFELRNFNTQGHIGSPCSLTAASPAGERLNWNGTIQLNPLKSQGTFEVQGLGARTVWNYIRDQVPFEIDSGVLGLNGRYDLAAGHGPPDLGVEVTHASLTHLAVKPKGAAEHYVEIGEIAADGTRMSLSNHAVAVTELRVSGGQIRSWLSPEGRLNLLDLMPAATTGAAAGPAPKAVPRNTHADQDAPAGWRVAIPDIQVEGLALAAEDRGVTPAMALRVAPLRLHVTGWRTWPAPTLGLQLAATINGSGTVQASGRLAPDGGLVAHAEAAGLELPALQPYLARQTSMTLLKGVLGTTVDVERHAAGDFTVHASAQIANLRTIDNALRQDFVSWQQLRVNDAVYRSRPTSLRIASISATAPYARLVIAPDRSTNFTSVLRPPGAAPPAPTVSSAPAARATHGHAKTPDRVGEGMPAPTAPLTPFPITVGTLRVAGATADYADLWIKPSFSIGIQSLAGTISGISSDPASRAAIKLDGKVDRYSPLSVTGSANLLSAALFTDVTLSFKDLDLPVVNPYSGYFAGYRINKGKLSVDVHYQIDHRRLEAAQHFVVDQLELGEHVDSPQAVHVPLKLAVALLKDRHGVIDLNLPMNGSLDDPKFRIGPIIWKVFVNLLTKAVTAPFALLGHLVGGGEQMNVVTFAAGSAVLDGQAQQQVASLAKGLGERPGLKLDVPIVSARPIDAPVIAAQRLRSQLLASAESTKEGKRSPDAAQAMLADPAQRFKLLVQQFQTQMPAGAGLPPSVLAIQQAKRGHAPSYEPAIAELESALLAQASVTDADLEELGKQRAQAIEDGLLAGGQLEPGRVFIVGTSAKPQSGDKVQVEMALK